MNNDLRNAMLDADMNARAWSKMIRIFSFYDTGIRIFLGITASSAVAGWMKWSEFPGAWKTLSAISAIAAIISPILNISKTVRSMADVAGKWQMLLVEYESMARADSELEIKASLKRFDELKKMEARNKSSENTLPYYKWVLRQAFNDVIRSRSL